MDISLEDLKVALGRAQVAGFTEASDLAGFTFGYLSAGPLGTPEPVPDVGTVLSRVADLNALPVGTEVGDRDGDYWIHYEQGKWTWHKYASGHTRLAPEDYYEDNNLDLYLPMTVTKIGA